MAWNLRESYYFYFCTMLWQLCFGLNLLVIVDLKETNIEAKKKIEVLQGSELNLHPHNKN